MVISTEQQQPPGVEPPDGSRGKKLQDEKLDAEAERRSSPGGRIVYHAILKEAKEELLRPSMALFWSGIAAGLSMGFSMICQGLLTAMLPKAQWTHLVASFGYTIGFLMVILGRQQLFTENTLTPILPLLRDREWRLFVNVMRLWSIILLANLLGAWVAAGFAMHSGAFDPDVRGEFVRMGITAMSHAWVPTMIRGIFGGWLIATIVWLLPYAETARIWVIVILSYFVGVGHFSHIIAGAVEVFAAAWAGQKPWPDTIVTFIIPTLIGNIIGGVLLVAALNYAQVTAGREAGQE